MYIRLIIVLVFNLFLIEGLNGQEKTFTKQDSCFDYLESYSRFWKKDKLGQNGFRQLFADLILTKCDFAGKKWVNLVKYLGNPNAAFTLDHEKHYRYRLNFQSNDIKEVGTMLLDIVVDSSGFVIGFSIAAVDG